METIQMEYAPKAQRVKKFFRMFRVSEDEQIITLNMNNCERSDVFLFYELLLVYVYIHVGWFVFSVRRLFLQAVNSYGQPGGTTTES